MEGVIYWRFLSEIQHSKNAGLNSEKRMIFDFIPEIMHEIGYMAMLSMKLE